MAFDVSRLTRLPVAYYCALFFGLAVMILTLAAPHWQLERGVLASGVDHVIRAAQPPLGLKARVLLAGLAGVMTAAGICASYFLYRLVRPRKAAPHFYAPPVAVAPAHDDVDQIVPNRRPIFADQELGAPLMSDAALERAKLSDWQAQTAVSAENSLAEAASHTPPRSVLPDSLADVPPKEMADTKLLSSLSLNDMVARLEAGLAQRNPIPPAPPASRAGPASHEAPSAITPPLSVVPSATPPHDESATTLHDTMQALSKLVGGAR